MFTNISNYTAVEELTNGLRILPHRLYNLGFIIVLSLLIHLETVPSTIAELKLVRAIFAEYCTDLAATEQ